MKPATATVAALALFGLLAVSVLSAASMQRASALEAIEFTTKDTLSSQNTLFQQVSESATGPDYVTFLDATGSGTYNRQHYSNYALQFNGSDEYAQAGANTVFDITTQDFSIIGFIELTANRASHSIVYEKVDGSVGYFAEITPAEEFQPAIRLGGNDVRVIITSHIMTVGTKYAWAASYDRDGSLTAYLYNLDTDTLYSQAQPISSFSASITNTETFGIASYNGGSEFCSCVYDDLTFVGGSAISQANFLAWIADPASLTETSAYYFNEGSGSTAYDEIASNNLTLQNSPAYVSNTPTNSISTVAPAATTTLTGSGNTINSAAYMGPVDLSRYSLSFASASSQYVNVPDNAALDQAQFTMAFWAKRTAANTNFNHLVSRYDSPNIGWTWETGNAGVVGNDKVDFILTNAAGTDFGGGNFLTLPLDTWSHLAVTFNGSSIKIYQNGTLIYTVSFSGTYGGNVGVPLRFASAASFVGNHWSGGLDDYFFYNTAKSDAQILSIYNGGYDTSGLTAYYDFNDGVGTNLDDRFGSNDGTLINTPTWSSDVTTNSLSRPTSYITGRDTATGNNGYAKINLSDLSKVGEGYATSSYYPRNIAQSTGNLWSPLYENTANGRMHIAAWSRSITGYGEALIYTGSAGNPAHGLLMDTSSAASSTQALYGAGNNLQAEHVLSTSVLVGKKIDRVTVYLSKTNSPTGTITIGVFDSSGNAVHTFGTQDSAALTGSQTAYIYLGAPYVVQSGDYIGVKYTGGDISNTVDVGFTNADVFDSTNSVRAGKTGAGAWSDDATRDTKSVFANTSNVKIAVYDGSPDTEYVFFESGASSLAVVKYTNAASTISTSLSHTAGKDYSIMQMSGKILIQTSEATYTLTTSTDAITTDSNTYLTRPPQTFSISPSARTYISAAYVANEETATLYNPSADTSASDYVMIDTASAPTLTAYDPAKYYYLQTNDLTVEAASLAGTSWTIKEPGTQENITVTPYTETLGVALMQNNTIFDENVIVVNCDNGNYDVTIPYFAVGSDADCMEWWTYDVDGASAARHLPYSATVEPVHANEYTYYTFTLSVADPTVYSLTTIYGGKDVDTADFDSSGQLQQRLLYQQCYTINVEEILTGNSVQTGNVCAGDDTTKSVSLSGIVIPPDWLGQTWSHSITRNFTSPGPTNNGLLFAVQKSETPYNASIHWVDHPDPTLATDSGWANFTNAVGISIANVTGINSNQTIFFTVYENGVIVINSVSSGMGFNFGDELGEFGLLFGVPIAMLFPILTAAVFPKSQAHIGIIATGAVIGIMQFFGFFSSIQFNEALWGVAIGLMAIGVMLGSRR